MNSFTDFWCFQLGSLTRKIARMYNSRFNELGITLGQSFVLFYLMEQDGKGVKDIASAVQLDSPSVTGLVDRLLKEGLVIRKEDPEDRRSVQVFITPQGREIAAAAGMIAIEFNNHLKQSLLMNAEAFERSLSTLNHSIDSFGNAAESKC
ncbi:MAG: MarR family winged helix-turn-helix transcriptional regulator [Ignavibacteriales bacterium]